MNVIHSYESEKWLTPGQASMLIPGNPSSVTVRKWCRQGSIPGAIQMPSGRWKIPTSALELMLQRGLTGVVDE